MPSPTAPVRRRRNASTAVITMLAALVVPATIVSGVSPAHAAAGAPVTTVIAKSAITDGVAHPATATLAKNVTANLFEWNWPSISTECTNVLGPDGYAAVQVSPPEDSLQASGNPWWQVYQPVDYNLTSMMGNLAQFQAMVTTCHAAGVKVYVDAVLNHMAAQPTSGSGTSFGGETYDPSTLTYPAYTSADFHSYPADCPESSNSIVNWLSYTEVTECQLEGLPDLATETTYVHDTEAAYLNSLIADGVDGFRLDSATEIGETDIAAIEALLNPDTTSHSPVYITQEVYPGSSGQDARLNPTSFEPEGSVTSFDYSYALTDDFENGDIAALNSFSPELPSAYASSFVTNQDTERASPPTLNYTNGAEYVLADEFLLAYGYGTPQIYSSFDFSSYNQSPPVNSAGDVTNTVCGQGTWECTEQTPAIAALVGWHNLAFTDNDPVQNWTTDGNDLVAFSRGSDAWIALNNGSSALTGTFPTGLANGTYCDIVNDVYSSSGSCSGTPVTVSGGTATVTVPAEDAVAFDVNDLVTSTTTPPPPPPTTNLALGATITASSAASGYPASNTNDGNTSTYWESLDGAAYPQTLTANLGAVKSLGSVTLDLPPATAWSTRTETLSVLGSTNGSSYATLVPSTGYTFNPSTGNTVSFNLPSGTSEQYLELSFTANTGWSAAQISEFEIFPGSGGGSTPPPGSATLTASPTSVSFGSETVGSTTAAQTVTVTNTGTAAATISSVSASSPFAETNTCGSTIAAGASCTASVTFKPTASGATSGNLTVASNATNGSLTVALTGTGTSSGTLTDLALNAPITASSYTQTYVPANADDGNTSTYWEGTNGAWPTTLTVNLGSTQTLGSVAIDLPPATAWSTRTQTLSILGSTNNSTFTTLVGSATYTFNPATGNTVSISLPSGTTDQYIELNFTANSVQNGAQASELDVYAP
jgi:alpha-amylase